MQSICCTYIALFQAPVLPGQQQGWLMKMALLLIAYKQGDLPRTRRIMMRYMSHPTLKPVIQILEKKINECGWPKDFQFSHPLCS